MVMVSDPLISTDYWTDIQITPQDIEFLHSHLFELETPLTARELVTVFINERIRSERLAVQRRREAAGRTYLPKESYQGIAHGTSIMYRLRWRGRKDNSIISSGKNIDQGKREHNCDRYCHITPWRLADPHGGCSHCR